MALANLSIYYTWKNVKSTYNNNKFKISAPTWNETFDLPDGSYNISESTSSIIDADKNSENVPRLKNVEVVLVHCNLVNNSYQQHSRVLFTFVPTKRYGQLISISPHSLLFLKTMNTEFSEIEVWFTDQNNNALEIEDNVNISLIINAS